MRREARIWSEAKAAAQDELEKHLELAYERDFESFARPRLISRRSFMWMIGGLLSTGMLGTGYARFVEPARIQIDEITLTLAHLPERLAGKRIAQISDVHVGEYFTPEQAAEAFQRVNRLGVDLLMLTGDFATVRERDRTLRLRRREEALFSLIEPLRLVEVPMVAAAGNHDHWGGLEPVARMLREAGVQLLRNEGVAVEDGLWLAGVEDLWGGRPDLGAALRDAPARAVILLMSHSPDYFDNVLRREAPVAAQFSGHTHGGQVRLPRLTPGPDGLYTYAPIVPEYGQRYPIGLRRIGERYVYTNRGLGCWPIPYRLNCPPEITVFTLQPV
jgi:predicted MPP superfamily phosphohydrolase